MTLYQISVRLELMRFCIWNSST